MRKVKENIEMGDDGVVDAVLKQLRTQPGKGREEDTALL